MTNLGDNAAEAIRRETGVGLRQAIKRVAFAGALLVVVLVVPLVLCEIAFRAQWFDAYRPELHAYNPPDALTNSAAQPTLLALGDSFTAGTATYPDLLRAQLPGWRIINAGVSGTGIIQAEYVAPRRLKQFAPDVCVYQLYVGNDLFDVRYPVGGDGLSLMRRGYWFLANHLRVIGLLNYRLGQWRAGCLPAYAVAPAAPHRREAFSPAHYDARERLYLSAEPALLDNHILVTAARSGDYARLLGGLARLHNSCRAAECALVLLIIPHAVQVAPVYRDRILQLGATLAEPERLSGRRYPFAEGIRQAFADQTDVRIVDPLEALQAAERAGETMYFTHDGHLNFAGQARVAQQLAEEVASMGVVHNGANQRD